MIDIIRFRELMVELQVKVNQKSEDKIDCCFLAVKEEHMVKKLKDKQGYFCVPIIPMRKEILETKITGRRIIR